MPTVLVTGAARGIGRSIVTQLADSGWDVVAGVRTEQDAENIVALNPARITSVLSPRPTTSPRSTGPSTAASTR